MADAVSNVLEDDDLLTEILLRLGFATSLVHAALVCKHWLSRASDPSFLHRFHKLHPPRLLGFYFSKAPTATYFIPMLPQLPELAAVMRRVARFSLELDTYYGDNNTWRYMFNCHNGRLLTLCWSVSRWTIQVHSFLRDGRGMAIIPTVPRYKDDIYQNLGTILPAEEGNDVSYLYLSVECNRERTESMVRVHALKYGIWRMHTAAACHLIPPGSEINFALVHNKIYIGSLTNIDVLDLTSSSLSTIQLPQGVEFDNKRTVLSRTDDASSVYLIHVKKFQLHIWLHKSNNWLLVDTICLCEMFAKNRTFRYESTADVHINGVGDNAAFVFLTSEQCVLYLDIKWRALRKVPGIRKYDIFADEVYPFVISKYA